MSDTDHAWLAGMWEGEGTITLFSHTEKNGSQKIKPMVSVVNTDIALVNQMRKVLESLGCNFNLTERRPKNSRHSTVWVLQSGNMDYIIKFLSAVLPYMYGEKKQKGEILLAYSIRRAQKMERLPSRGSTPYDEEDRKSLEEFESINLRKSNNNRSSSTTRDAPAQG